MNCPKCGKFMRNGDCGWADKVGTIRIVVPYRIKAWIWKCKCGHIEIWPCILEATND